jgi:hypothetical protein
VRYEKVAECLNKDRDALLTFYDSFASSSSQYETSEVQLLASTLIQRHLAVLCRSLGRKGRC